MNKFSAVFNFIKEKRTILASVFLAIGLLSSMLTVMIALQRPQTIRSRASEEPGALENSLEFKSAANFFKLSYDQRQWKLTEQADPIFGSRAIFSLSKEYGLARVDIIEGESEQDLDSLTKEIAKEAFATAVSSQQNQFQGKQGYLVKYKEEILGEDIYFYQQIVKDGNKFLIIEKRAPQLGYNQPYLDNLLTNLSFVGTTSSQQVKGVSEVSSDLTTVELVDLIRPSVANIVYVYCLDIVNIQPGVSGLSQSKYNFCGSSKGSGFIINETGIVATNGHVTKVYPEEGLVTNLLNEGSKAFATDLIKGVYASKDQTLGQNQLEDFYRQINANPQYLDRFLTEIFNLINKKAIVINNTNEKYYVNVGDAPIKVDYQKLNMGDAAGAVKPSSTTYVAEMLDFNFPNRYSYEAIVNRNYQRGADVALLRIRSSSNLFPAVELGSTENLREGSEIIVAGYPTLVEGTEDPRAAISYKSSTKPTITRGIVSAIKEDITGKKVLQTDASIDHGNSGGPAFNSSGQVIGIATFMEESKTGNFNFLRDISELKELMEKNKIDNKLGELTGYWRKGLDNFRNRYYNQAIAQFKQVEAQSPAHPTVKEFISLSDEGIKEGKSLEGFIGFFKSPQGSGILLIIFGSMAIVSFMSSGFLWALPLFAKKDTYVG